MPAERRRVLVVDDDADFRLVLRLALDGHPGFTVVGEASDGPGAVAAAAGCRPDLVLLDTNLADLDAFDVLPAIQAAAPKAQVVLVSSHDPADLGLASRAAAVGFLPKATPARRLGDELEAVAGLVGAIEAALSEARTRLGRDELTPRAARRFVQDALREWDVAELTDTVTLLVSELVTNAVVHADSDVEVLVRLTPGSACVEVTDAADATPVPRDARMDDDSGRGLALVEALARRWGVRRVPGGGKTVWFEVDREPKTTTDGAG